LLDIYTFILKKLSLFNPETKFHRIFEDIENINLPADVVDRKIKAKGIALYDELFPPSLKKIYWEKRDKIKSIRVLSKEPWIAHWSTRMGNKIPRRWCKCLYWNFMVCKRRNSF